LLLLVFASQAGKNQQQKVLSLAGFARQTAHLGVCQQYPDQMTR
jgi:hypothetical protein